VEKRLNCAEFYWLFLASVVAGYGVTALVEAGKARLALAAFVPMLGTVRRHGRVTGGATCQSRGRREEKPA
jgi:hypothetical protein